MRDIFAAWVVCGLLGFGALTMVGHHDVEIAMDARVTIPDRLGSARPDLSIADEYAEDARDAPSTASNSEEAPVESPQQVAASARCRLRSFAHHLL